MFGPRLFPLIAMAVAGAYFFLSIPFSESLPVAAVFMCALAFFFSRRGFVATMVIGLIFALASKFAMLYFRDSIASAIGIDPSIFEPLSYVLNSNNEVMTVSVYTIIITSVLGMFGRKRRVR